MHKNVILAGIGGQGILTLAAIVDHAAMQSRLQIKQAEVHGMSQRGGAVQSHLRIANKEIYSDLIPKGKAHLIVSLELLKRLRIFLIIRRRSRLFSKLRIVDSSIFLWMHATLPKRRAIVELKMW
mgnify:CR=1 FL=1